jgi:hypothetical protein
MLPASENPAPPHPHLPDNGLFVEAPAPVDNPEFGAHERMLGVAVNRQRLFPYPESPTCVNYYSRDTDVAIDLEHDPALVDFLQSVKNAVGDSGGLMSAAQAEKVTRRVIAQTPQIDNDDSYHERRTTTLGEALQHPVVCIDRCLAMDASLKMFGYSDARHLNSIVRDTTTDEVEHHADVAFTINGESYVAITMGAFAGTVMPATMYMDGYLDWRKSQGLIVTIPQQEAETFFQVTG